MSASIKICKREAAVLDRFKTVRGVLCCEVDDTEEGRRHSCRRWFIEPGGSVVGPATATKLVKKGLVVRNTDGLFHEFDAQTYAVAP